MIKFMTGERARKLSVTQNGSKLSFYSTLFPCHHNTMLPTRRLTIDLNLSFLVPGLSACDEAHGSLLEGCPSSSDVRYNILQQNSVVAAVRHL